MAMTHDSRAPVEAGDPAPVAHLAGESPEDRIRARLGHRPVVLVGLMGVGKSTLGRRLAARLGLPFKDADQEIESAAGMSIPEMFASHGESYFRDGERRVIARILQDGPMVLATGGGAFINEETRARVAQCAVSVWLRADLDVLMRRVRKRATRPLLQAPDPEAVMRGLMEARHPVYALADIVVESRDVPHDRVVGSIIEALDAWLSEAERSR
jgi:shikimate kinase